MESITDTPTPSQAEEQTCKTCGATLIATRREFSNHTIHIEQRCANGHFIQYLPQYNHIEKMPFGSYKGQRLKDLPDDYRRWLLRKAHIGRSLRRALEIVSGQGGFARLEYQ
jgi:hypothetical protein